MKLSSETGHHIAAMVSGCQRIIWDWNGTLLDDLSLCVGIINDMLAQRGLPRLTRDHYRNVFTFPVRDYYQSIGFDFLQNSHEELSREFVIAYNSRWRECFLYPQARRLVERIRASGMRQSILSALHRETLSEQVNTFDIGHLFEHLMGLENNFANSKIEQGQRLVAMLPDQPSEMLLVGDTLHDVEVAEAMGTACVLVAHGHQSKERLKQSGAPVMDSLRELMEVVLNSERGKK